MTNTIPTVNLQHSLKICLPLKKSEHREDLLMRNSVNNFQKFIASNETFNDL